MVQTVESQREGRNGGKRSKNLYAYMHNPRTQTIWWRRPRAGVGDGPERVNGGKKRDICNTFNNKDFSKNKNLPEKRLLEKVRASL